MLRKRDWCIYLLFFILSACGTDKTDPNRDTKEKGTITISADETFKPVIEQQIQVYRSDYPDAKINVQYKPEADCLKDLMVDSIRMIIVTKWISEDEEEFLEDSLNVSPEQMMVANDAIAVIIHPDEEITRFTMKDLKEICQGKFRKNLIPVFDGLKATSTVRFIVDSLLRGDSLTSKAMAARSSEEVVEYVSKTPAAIGFVGISWIGNKDDEQQKSFLTKVRIAELECKGLPGQYVQPLQVNIYNELYPMIRELVFILKENYKGLGHGFSNFMTSERGQLIFRRAYLAPGYLPFIVRPVNVRE